MDAVRCFVDKSQNNWDEHLPQFASTIRSSLNRHTCLTPNKLVLGSEVRVPADLVLRPSSTNVSVDYEDYVSRLQESIRTAHEVARDALKIHQVHMKRDYDVKIHTREHAVGNFIYVLESAKTNGRSKKLDPPWKGPGITVQKLSLYLYKVKLQKMVFRTNHDRLKECNDRKVPVWHCKCQHRLHYRENVLESESLYM